MFKLYPEKKKRLLNFLLFIAIIVVLATAITIYDHYKDRNNLQGRTQGIMTQDTGE
jgi:hypothetical protein